MANLFTRSSEALQVDLLLLPDFSLLSLAATMEPLRAANRVSGRTLYRWRLISADGASVRASSGVLVPADAALSPDNVGDTLIVVAAFNVLRYSTPALLAVLRRVARRGIPLGGVESGAWTLALAGLLSGRRATTHWEDLEEFAARFPDVHVRPDRFVIDGSRYTTGGASPALDMMLNLIRVRHGHALALDVASVFIYDQSRAGEDPQPTVSLGHLSWDEPRVSSAIRLMEERLERPLAIPAIARHLRVSVRTVDTLFQRTVGMPPRDYYLALRLNAARRLVLDSRKTIIEIATQTGFASASAFARSFRSRFNESPREARRHRNSSGRGIGSAFD